MAAKIGAVGKAMTVAGTAITAAFGAIIMKTTQLGDTYDKMSKRTNVTVEDLSALGYAAKISGADLATVEKSLRFLAQGMGDMQKGVGEAKDAFEELNITVTNTEGNLRPTMDVLKEAATKLAAMTDETKQISLATDIFGSRYGTQLLPMLKEGGKGIEALMEKAKELGIVMSTEAAADAAEFNDRITDLKESVGAIGRDIGSILIPPLIKFSEKAIEVIKNIREWADAHKPLIEMITTVTATLGVLAATGGPILMGVAAFMKLKGAMLLVKTGGISPLNASILLITANIIIWKQVIDEVNKVLASHHTSLQDVTDAQNILAESQEKLATKLGISVEELKEFQKNGTSVSEMMGKELVPEVKELEKNLDFAFTATGNFGLGLKAAKTDMQSFSDGVKTAVSTLQNDFAVSMDAVINKIYEFTHTDYEVTLKGINEEYDALIEKAKKAFLSESELADAIKTLNEARQLEIDKLKEVDEPQKKVIENTIEMTDKEKDLAAQLKLTEEEFNKYKKTIEETDEATKNLNKITSEELNDAFGGVVKNIDFATASLNNFTIAGVAAAVANIKMSFVPAINDLKEVMHNVRDAFFAADLSARDYNTLKIFYQNQINDLYKEQAERIDIVMDGLKEYNKIVASMSGGGSSSGFTVPSYAVGTPSVPQTGLAMVHKGEAIIPASQNTTNNKSTSTLNIQPGAINIVTPKFSSADGQELFRQLERQIKMRGLKLVRA